MDTAAEFKAWLLSEAPFKLARAEEAIPNHLGALVGHLDTTCGGTENRHLFLEYLFGNQSAKALTPRQANSLYLWLAVRADAEGKWQVTNPRARATAAAVVTAALRAAGQLDFSFAEQAQREAEERGQRAYPQRPA